MLLTRRGGAGPVVTSGLGVAPTVDGRLGLNIDVIRATTAEAAAAAFDEAWERSPLQSMLRLSELNRAMEQSPQRRAARRDLAEILAGETLGVSFEEIYTPETEPEAPVLSPQDAADVYPDLHLSFDEPVTREYIDLVAEARRSELRRQLIMSRADGFFAAPAMFAAELIASMADPINIVASFIPVVGQARFMRMVERFGPTGARAARGGIEGLAGAAAVEPIVLAAAQRQQADYGIADSLLNIAFGTFVGGGLHVAGGVAHDLHARMRGVPDLRERLELARATEGYAGLAATVEALPIPLRREYLRAAMAQAVNGRTVDVARALETLPSVQRLREVTNRLTPGAAEAPIAERAPQSAAEPPTTTSVLPAMAREDMTTINLSRRPTLREALALPEMAEGDTPLVVNHGPLADRPADGLTRLDIDRLPRALIENQVQEIGPAGEQTFRYESRGRDIRAVVHPAEDGRPARVDVSAGGREPPPAPEPQAVGAGNVVDFPRRAVEPMPETVTPEREAARAVDPRGDAVADFDAVAEVDRVLAEAGDEAQAVADELQDLTAQVEALRQTDELSAEDMAALETAQLVADEAQRLGDAYIGAAFCLTGRAA